MRTTLNIENDVLHTVKQLARQEGRTAGQVISALARQGLAALPVAKSKRPALRGGVPVLPSRGEVVSLEHIQRLMDREEI